MNKLHFLTAGIPLSTPGKKNIVSGLQRVKELGLDGMELEYVRGITYDPLKMISIRQQASDLDLILSAHAPYYINFNAQEKSKIEKSFHYVMETARALDSAHGYSLVFHAGYYMKQDKQIVYDIIKRHLIDLITILKKESLQIWIRPETMGKPFQFGTVEELVQLSLEIGHPVLPCFDFSHIHALTAYNNSYQEWAKILDFMVKELGQSALENMHIHYSGIQYNNNGEIRHLILRISDARYRELLKVLKDYDARGILVCESPNVEGDALLLQKTYLSFK